MNINIIGSTGIIGSKALKILKNNFKNLNVNLLFANNNHLKLIYQANIYKPKIVCLKNNLKYKILKKEVNKNIKIISENELNDYLKETESVATVLSIAGYNSLNYLSSIIKNTKYLGLVNKECIVSAGHLFANVLKNKNIHIYPLDSEHYSLKDYFVNNTQISFYKNIYLTASGGPFLSLDRKSIKNKTFNDAIKHPKWIMGYKNSVDSATLVNKCLEIIEAHYLYDIPIKKLNILIHPEALVHSVVEYNNYCSKLNYFYHDMEIPIYNFLNHITKNNKFKNVKKYNFNNNAQLNFYPVNKKKFRIYDIFSKLEFSPTNLIKFNLANEYAIELFKKDIIKFGEIDNIINNSLSIGVKFPVNTFKNILKFTEIYVDLLKAKYEFE